MTAFRSQVLHDSGKSVLTFNPIKGRSNYPLHLPCGKCTGCRLEKSRQWAIRMMHEAKCWENNAFLTLTYSDKYLPASYSLQPDDLKLFMYRLRDRLAPIRVRFYACGEYGDRFGRPHYHMALFNYAFEDKVIAGSNGLAQPYWSSETLEKIWGLGNCMIGKLEFQSAAYIARYVTKKITGPSAVDHYTRVSPVDGRVYCVHPEFARMSLRPGIGHTYTEKFKGDYFPSGFIIVNGVKQRPPRFYIDKLTEKERQRLKYDSISNAMRHRSDNTKARRAVRAEARDLRIKKLQRTVG